MTHLLNAPELLDVLFVRGGDGDAHALQGLHDVLEHNIGTSDSHFLPAKGEQELVSILRVLICCEPLWRCSVSMHRSTLMCGHVWMNKQHHPETRVLR